MHRFLNLKQKRDTDVDKQKCRSYTMTRKIKKNAD